MKIDVDNMESLAPVSITVYNRENHFYSCIKALQKNTFANKTHLYIFSDAPSCSADEKAVQNIRQFATNIQGFREVSCIFQDKNNSRLNNALARSVPLAAYNKIIRLEDDIIAAPGFLNFINSALDFYKDDPDIINVCGYAPPIRIPDNYINDAFVLKRPCAWGWGYFSDILEIIESDSSSSLDYLSKLLSDSLVHRFHEVGQDVKRMALNQSKVGEFTGDVKLMLYQLLNSKLTVYPRNSLVQNIGHDGSGLHCGKTKKFFHEQLWDKDGDFMFHPSPQLIPEIVNANYDFRSYSSSNAVKYKIKRLARFLFGT